MIIMAHNHPETDAVVAVVERLLVETRPVRAQPATSLGVALAAGKSFPMPAAQPTAYYRRRPRYVSGILSEAPLRLASELASQRSSGIGCFSVACPANAKNLHHN